MNLQFFKEFNFGHLVIALTIVGTGFVGYQQIGENKNDIENNDRQYMAELAQVRVHIAQLNVDILEVRNTARTNSRDLQERDTSLKEVSNELKQVGKILVEYSSAINHQNARLTEIILEIKANQNKK
jgi:phage gp29-like protein